MKPNVAGLPEIGGFPDRGLTILHCMQCASSPLEVGAGLEVILAGTAAATISSGLPQWQWYPWDVAVMGYLQHVVGTTTCSHPARKHIRDWHTPGGRMGHAQKAKTENSEVQQRCELNGSQAFGCGDPGGVGSSKRFCVGGPGNKNTDK